MRRLFLIALLFAGLSSLAVAALAAESKDATPDPRAEALLTRFLQALQTEDESQRVRACLPHLHASLLTADGKDLTPQVKNFQFQKASKNAKWYELPVKITRVRPRDASDYNGREYNYSIARKEDGAGPPAPVTIFFPDNGGEPKILYMGSL
jgi:hypothetical protein